MMLGGSPARSQTIRPWMPPSADSLQRWASDAKVAFRENQGDSVGGPNFRAYNLVGNMGRRLVRSLGRSGLLQAHAVGVMLDSLGLDTEVTVDPQFPEFVLLMVRNPYRLTARALGFLYWYQGNDLRMQGAMFFGGQRPVMRVWWTAYPDQPYSLGILDREREVAGRTRLTLFRMDQRGLAWNIVQAPDQGPDLTGVGNAALVDINADDRPELVAWIRGENDSLFETCLDCPGIIHEQVYTESRPGFFLSDVRILPTPYSTFTLFIRLLGDGNRAAAARLLKDPAKMDEVIAEGWGLRGRGKAWKLEYTEEERWPTWLEFLHRGPKGDKRYVVHFELKGGRWIIRDWVTPHRSAPVGRGIDSVTVRAPQPPASKTPSKTTSKTSGKSAKKTP
jgi:hypothetical protein